MRRILFVNASISWVSWVVRMMVVPWSLLISRIILRTAIFETASVVPAKAAGHDFNGTAFSGAVGTKEAVNLTVFDGKVQMIHCQMAAVIFYKIFYFNHCLCPPVSFL